MTGISCQELMHYAEGETRRWQEFFRQRPDALDLDCDIAGASDIRGLVLHIFAVELRYAERLSGNAPPRMTGFQLARSARFSTSESLLDMQSESMLLGPRK